MKSIRGCSTAASDPNQPFAQETSEVCFGGLTGPTKTPITAPFSVLPIAVTTTYGYAQHPRTAISTDYMGSNK